MTFPVTVTIPVLWGDMDAFGHVNNARYLTWLESARIELFRRVGVATSVPDGVAPILATATCDYLEPVTFPATVAVSVRVTKIGETSMAMEYEVRDADSGALRARGSSVVVMFDYAKQKKVAVPDDVRAAALGLLP